MTFFRGEIEHLVARSLREWFAFFHTTWLWDEGPNLFEVVLL